MSRPAPSPSPSDSPTGGTDSLDGWERALLDRQLEALGRLADMGMAIAGAIERRATAGDAGPDADLQRASMDFARVSRAVRMTYALQSRLVADFKARPEPRSAEVKAEAEDADEGPMDVIWVGDTRRYVVQKREMRGIVRRVAMAADLDREAVERLVREAGERLEHDEAYEDFVTRPVGEVLALICADLGLEPDWGRLASEHWAQLEIARRRPGSPFAEFFDRPRPAPSAETLPPGAAESGWWGGGTGAKPG